MDIYYKKIQYVCALQNCIKYTFESGVDYRNIRTYRGRRVSLPPTSSSCANTSLAIEEWKAVKGDLTCAGIRLYTVRLKYRYNKNADWCFVHGSVDTVCFSVFLKTPLENFIVRLRCCARGAARIDSAWTPAKGVCLFCFSFKCLFNLYIFIFDVLEIVTLMYLTSNGSL